MKRLVASLVACIALTSIPPVLAQEGLTLPRPVEEHQWLKQIVGEWESESEAFMGPGQPPMKCKGTVKARMLGDFWLVSDSTLDMKGVKMIAVQTIGYDPAKKKYVGTWVDSMVNYMWQYEGTVDASGKKLTLEAEGPNLMLDGKLTKYRDTYELKSPDHIMATASMLGPEGDWVQIMTGHLRRKK